MLRGTPCWLESFFLESKAPSQGAILDRFKAVPDTNCHQIGAFTNLPPHFNANKHGCGGDLTCR